MSSDEFVQFILNLNDEEEAWLHHKPCRKRVAVQDPGHSGLRTHLEAIHDCDPDKNWNGSAPRWEPAND